MPTTERNALPWEPLAQAGEVPVLLIRHARTAWNHERRMLGRTDIPLDEEGRAQAAALAAWLSPVPLAAVASSPLARAAETARALAAPRGLSVEPLPELVELDQGELDGQPSDALVERYAYFFLAWRRDPARTRVPGGETLGECQERAWSGLARWLAGRAAGPPVAVVVHQMVLAALLCRVNALPLRDYHRFSQRNTAMNLLSWSGGELRAVALDLCPHLPPAEAKRPLAV